MALVKQCKSCKKKGVFLKLENDLCPECIIELKILEKQYYDIKDVLNEPIELLYPDEVLDKANMILKNIDKFKDVYTPIKKDVCFKIVHAMENLKKLEEKSTKKIDDTPSYENFTEENEKTILNELPPEENIKEDLLNNVEENPKEDLNEDLLNSVEEIPKEDLNEGLLNSVEENPKEDLNEGLLNSVEKNPKEDLNEDSLKASKKAPIKDNDFNIINPFDNIIFDNNILKKSKNISSNKDISAKNVKEEDTKVPQNNLEKLKVFLTNLEYSNSENNKKNVAIPKSIDPEINLDYASEEKEYIKKEEESIKKEIYEFLPEATVNFEEEVIYNPVISTENLAKNIINILNNETLQPEKFAYNITLLKGYFDELKKDSILKINDIDINKFILDKEKELLKSTNKKFKLSFSFFNYVVFNITENLDNTYTLSAVKVCYGEIIDNFISKYTLNSNDNTDLDDINYTVQKFLSFTGNMLLISYNSNYNIVKLKNLAKLTNKVINNPYRCTKNDYLLAHLKQTGKKAPDLNIDSVFKFFYGEEELNSLKNKCSKELLIPTKTFMLHEQIKYIINIY